MEKHSINEIWICCVKRGICLIDFKGFRNYLYEEELSPNTIQCYMTGVRQFAEQYTDITKPTLIAFKQSMIEKGLKPQTVNNRITALLQYCKFKEIPMRVKQVKEQRKTHIDNVITADQVEHLLNSLKADGNMVWYYNILLLYRHFIIARQTQSASEDISTDI